MSRQRSGIFPAAIIAAASTVLVAGAANAGSSFKPKYYAECYALIADARAMVPPPPADIAGKVKAASDVAGAVSKIPGLGGLGGFGGAFGGLGGAAKQVTTYGNLISDAAKYTSKMQQDYPDPAARMAAYGDKMSGDADKIGEATLKIDGAQTCYANASAALKSGEIKGSEAKDRAKEILGGLNEGKSVLDDSRSTMEINMKGYNEALTTDSSSMGLDLGALGQMAGAAGVGSSAIPGQAAMGTEYEGYVTGANDYQKAWFDGYTKSGGDQNAAKLSALAAIQRDGGASANVPVKDYQSAYWAAQASQAKEGKTIGIPTQALGNLSALQSLGGLGGLSGGGAAWVAANGGIGAIGSAINGGGSGDGVPQAQTVAASGPDVASAMNTVNTMKGMSGGGGAWVAANGGIGAIGDALTDKNKQKAAAAAAQAQAQAGSTINPAMRGSLMKTSVDNAKFNDAYGLVNWQSQRNTEIAATVSAN